VQSVEHLLSALEACGIDNARIEIEGGQEIPVLDGSSMGWAVEIAEVRGKSHCTAASRSRLLVSEQGVDRFSRSSRPAFVWPTRRRRSARGAQRRRRPAWSWCTATTAPL
jgi:UDP-3-O-acyl N-acetylglycosamine deacetylase